MSRIEDRPCAAPGLVSYRYRGQFGWIMIGAKNDADAIREAKRSTHAHVEPSRLQVWSDETESYVDVSAARAEAGAKISLDRIARIRRGES